MARTGGCDPMAEMGVGVVDRGRAVGGPAGVGDGGAAGDLFGLDLLGQLGHARSAAGALQATRMNRHATGIVAAVFQPLQTLNQDGHYVTPRNPCHDATHDALPFERLNKRIDESVRKALMLATDA